MKKAIIIATICFITFCMLFITASKKMKSIDNSYYVLTCEVVKVDRNNDVVTCEDDNGNLWEFYGAEDWEIGDCASLLMWNCGTENILDDEVRSASYDA